MRETAYRHQLWDVFGDFVECSAIAISNAVDLAQRDRREARYMAIVGRYNATEIQAFPRMLAHLVEALEDPGDVLGTIFEELELGNSARGQFFTPYHLCKAMAMIMIGDGADMRSTIAGQGYVTVCDPAVGAGAQLIAFAMCMRDAGFNYQHCVHATGTDVDPRAVHMAYLQLALLYVPAVIVLGNTLTLEESDRWYTPAHIVGGWKWRLRRDVEQSPAPVALVEEPAQLQFALEAAA